MRQLPEEQQGERRGNSARITGDAHPKQDRPETAKQPRSPRRCRQTEVGKVAKVAQAISNLNGVELDR